MGNVRTDTEKTKKEKGKVMVNQCKKESESIRKYKGIEKGEVISTNTNSSKSMGST